MLLSAVVEAAHVALELSAGPDAHVEHAEVGAAEIESEIVALHMARESLEGWGWGERSKEEERRKEEEKRRRGKKKKNDVVRPLGHTCSVPSHRLYT